MLSGCAEECDDGDGGSGSVEWAEAVGDGEFSGFDSAGILFACLFVDSGCGEEFLVKVFSEGDVLLGFFKHEQFLVASQMSRHFLLVEEGAQNLLFLERGLAVPVAFQQLFDIFIVHVFLCFQTVVG